MFIPQNKKRASLASSALADAMMQMSMMSVENRINSHEQSKKAVLSWGKIKNSSPIKTVVGRISSSLDVGKSSSNNVTGALSLGGKRTVDTAI